MLNALREICRETGDYFFIIGEILRDIRRPWDLPGLPPEDFAFG